MATLTVEITDALQVRLDREMATGRFKDRNDLVQLLLEAGISSNWKENVENKIDEALDEIERGDVLTHKRGDFGRMGREYLTVLRAREANS